MTGASRFVPGGVSSEPKGSNVSMICFFTLLSPYSTYITPLYKCFVVYCHTAASVVAAPRKGVFPLRGPMHCHGATWDKFDITVNL